jgi:N-methylhydantoinase A
VERPIHIIESGPAGGVVGAQALAREKHLERIITFDMGGTTAKAAMVEHGEVTRAQEYAVGAGIMVGSRLLTGAGYTLKVPAIDIAEVGAGGGSHVWLDPAGALQVGPESAGASPGPVCYDKGGETPTVTDANLLLGYLNPAHLVGGALKLNAESARRVFDERIAKPLAMPLERAAHGAHLIAASNMIRAIRAVSSERGRDPREFALFAFGGNGPVFACGMAQALGMKRIVVPPSAGLFSSFGLLYADVEHHYSRTFRRLLRKSDRREIERAWDALAKQALDQLAVEGFTGSNAKVRKSAALHYHGQTYELTVALPDGPIDFAWLEEAFGLEHEKTYGHRAGADEPVELVSIQVVGQGLRGGPSVPQRVRSSRAEPEPPPPRAAYFGSWVETPVIRRSDLSTPRSGPLIIEEYDATCVVAPGARVELDAGGNIVIQLVA